MDNKIDFRISSGLKSIIGKDLITNDLIAIFELVKNSYDANSMSVEIIFKNIKNEYGKDSKIIIIDYGDGMSYDDLKDKWLFVGYSEKKDFEKELEQMGSDFRNKIQNRRIFTGAKGIGRFSCDRLGKELKLYTKKEKEDIIHSLHIDWTKFDEDQKNEFQNIKADHAETKYLPEEYGIAGFKKGTILEISLLNDYWDHKKLLTLKKYLQRLINPSQVDEKHEFNIYLRAEEYLEEDERNKGKGDLAIINGIVKNIVFEKLDIKTTQINCRIDEKGENIFTELIDKDKFIFSIKEKNVFPTLRHINVKLFFLNREAKSTFTRLMGIQPKNYGSILFYKNGFRIHPFGDAGDDWLGLEIRRGQGWMRNLSTRELMGRIEVLGQQPGFKEVSSRGGGLIETKEYHELKKFLIGKILGRLEKYVVKGINWDSERKPKTDEEIKEDSLKLINEITGQAESPEIKFNKDLLEIFKEKETEKIYEVIKNIETLKKYVKSPEEKEYIENQVKSVRRAAINLERAKKETEEKLKEKEKENIFLKSQREEIRGLNHHVGISTATINNHLLILKNKLQRGDLITNDFLEQTIDKISLANKKISTVAKIITKAKFDMTKVKNTTDMVSFVEQYIKNVLDSKYEEMGVDVIVDDDLEFEYKFNSIGMIIVIDNLLDNARKANANRVEIRIKRFEKDGIELIIKNDGKGIPIENIDKIFDLGFTTTGGTGIGLHHVKDIIMKMRGQIMVNDSLKKGAEFIIKLKK